MSVTNYIWIGIKELTIMVLLLLLVLVALVFLVCAPFAFVFFIDAGYSGWWGLPIALLWFGIMGYGLTDD